MKQWRSQPQPDGGRIDDMVRELQVPRTVASILLQRGLDEKTAALFLDPRLSRLEDPFLLPDMPAAVDRLWRALTNGERITVFGDYDADGITAAALAGRVLTELGGIVEIHLPHRAEEGYGLSQASLQRCLRDTRPDLLLTVDCGSCSAAAVAEARCAGVETILTDHHHLLAAPAPAALAVVNPQRTDCPTPPSMAGLAGVGVAFKLCHALLKRGRQRGVPAAFALDLRHWLELVALGTVADVAPLVGENRILVAAGLKQMNRRPGRGIQALVSAAGIRKPLSAHELAFALGPRLNAAGRLGDARTALDLLLSDDPAAATHLATKLDAANRDRRALVDTIMTSAGKQIEELRQHNDPFGIVIGDKTWHVGVIGIVASRITEKYHRPTVVVSFDENGHGRGSARSIDDFNLLEGLQSCADSLLTFGGHALAAGLSVHADAFETFRQQFNQAGAAVLEGRDLRPVLSIDGWLTAADITDELLSALQQLAPFGEGNPQPVLAVRGVRPRGRPRMIGNGNHLKMMLDCGATPLDAVGFNLGRRQVPDDALDVAFRLVENHFRGRRSLQLHLQDFRPA